MKDNYQWLRDFYTTNMTQNDYDDMWDYVQDKAGDDEEARNKATEDFLNNYFRQKQKTGEDAADGGRRQVSQRQGVKTMVNKWANNEDDKGQSFFSFTKAEKKSADIYSGEQLKEFEKGKFRRPKTEEELAGSIVKEYDKASDDDKRTLNRLLSRVGLNIEQLRTSRDEVAPGKGEQLIKVAKSYNEAKSNIPSFEQDYVGSTEERERFKQLKQQGLSDIEAQTAIFNEWSLSQKKTQEKQFINLTQKDDYPDIPTFKKLERTIKVAAGKGDVSTINDALNVIERYKTQDKYRDKQVELQRLHDVAESVRADMRLFPGKRFTTVIPVSVKSSVADEAFKGKTSFFEPALKKAEEEVSKFLPRDKFFDTPIWQREVDRKRLELAPGIVSVEEKLKQRLDLPRGANELQFLEKVSKTPIRDLARKDFREIDLGPKSRNVLIDEIILRETRKPDPAFIVNERNRFKTYDEGELASMAFDAGIDVSDKDILTLEEVRKVKQISARRLKDIKQALKNPVNRNSEEQQQ